MTVNQRLQEITEDLHGAAATDEEIESLEMRLPPGLRPDWLLAMLKGYRLGGVRFSLSKEHDRSALGAEVIWLTPQQIVSEACDAEPGISVSPSGFLPIGACAAGSGDPYFLDLREATTDPPVVRIPHEYGGHGSYPLNRVELITSSLSEFIGGARLR